MAKLGITKEDTRHGMRMELLPAGTVVKLKKAHNQPQPGPIQYWAYPAKGHNWANKRLKDEAIGYGIGLGREDVIICKG